MITLSDLKLEEYERVWSWANFPRSAFFDDFGPKTAEEFKALLAIRLATEYVWGVYSHSVDGAPNKGSLIGYAGATEINPLTAQLRGMVLDPKHRGKGYGIETLKLVKLMLIQRGYNKVMGSCFSTNGRMISVFRKVSAEREGFLKNVTEVGGISTDLILWSM